MRLLAYLVSVCLATTGSTSLANSLVSPGPRPGIAKSKLSAVPDSEWNRLKRKDGNNIEVWTLDGDQLNQVTFFGGVPVDKPLFKELDKKNRPLPKVRGNMLITDIPELLESTYRIQYRVNQMTFDGLEPASLGGHPGIRFAYSFTRSDDEVERKGEGVGAMIGGALYMITYEAPSLYFFEKDVEKYRKLAGTVKF